MRKTLLLFLSLLSATAFAQNIDQSVVVSNDYIVQFSDFQRETVKPTLADSLYKFDYNFDYSVFDSPYKGSFEFTPYQVSIVPDALPYNGKTLYLRTGAGYSMYPQLDFVYIPVVTDKFRLVIRDNAHAHFGEFASTAYDHGNYQAYKGYYLFNDFDLGATLNFNKSKLSFDASFGSRYAKTSTNKNDINTIGFNLNFASNLKSKIEYSLKAICKTGFINGSVRTVYTLSGKIVPIKIGAHSFAINAEYKNGSPFYIYYINPSYRITKERYNLSLGIKFDNSFTPPSTSIVTFAPMVDYRLVVLKDKLNFNINVSGGQGLFSSFGTYTKSPLYQDVPYGYYKEVVNAKAGIDGRLSKFAYNIEAGYKILKDFPIDGLRTMIVQDLDLVFGKAGFSWTGKRFSFDSELHINYSIIKGNRTNGFTPSMVEAKVDATYNWMNRIYAGIRLQGASTRKNISGLYSDVPGYIDLGLYGEYKFSSKMSMWLNSGNLLAMPIEKIPGLIEKSPYCTLGLTLVL